MKDWGPMRVSLAILVSGLLIAFCSGGAILWTNRYQIDQPFEPTLFKRYDRWTGRIELCSSYYDERTYCGTELSRRADEGVRAEHAYANKKFLSWGYSQEQIDSWPEHVLQGARNSVGNGGGSAESLKKWLKDNHVN
jgi:hypothetical protein